MLYLHHVIKRGVDRGTTDQTMLVITTINFGIVYVLMLVYVGMHFKLTAASTKQTVNNTNVQETIENCLEGKNVTDFTISEDTNNISEGAFKGTKINTLKINSIDLNEKSVKGCLKGSGVSEVVVDLKRYDEGTRKKYYEAYKKFFSNEDIVGKTSNGSVAVTLADKGSQHTSSTGLLLFLVAWPLFISIIFRASRREA